MALAVRFLTNHRWVRPRSMYLRSLYDKHSIRGRRNADPREYAWRWYCIKCGASKRSELIGPTYGAIHRTWFRPPSDIERPITKMPGCPGHPICEAMP
jgi:hypothetical protein